MDIKETRNEIIKRSILLEKKREKRIMAALESSCAALAIALIAVMGRISAASRVSIGETAYGSLLLGPTAGAYVLVGIICFLLGVLITMIAVRTKKNRFENPIEEDDEE